MPTMVRSLVACRAVQVERRAANAAAATAMVRGASSSPPLLPAHPPALPCPKQNGCHHGNGDGEERLLTPIINRTVAIFELLLAASGHPTTALSVTTTIAATTTAPAGNDNINESLKLNEIPDHFVCPITKMIMTDAVSNNFGHSYEKSVIKIWLSENNTSPVTGEKLPHVRITHIHSLWNIIQDFCRSRDATTAAATSAAAGIESNIALSNASSRLNSGSRNKKKKSDRMLVLKPAAHSQPELDLLNDFDWDDADKVQDVVLNSLYQKVQLDVMAKNLAEVKRSLAESNRIFNCEYMVFGFDWTRVLSFVSLLFPLIQIKSQYWLLLKGSLR